MDQDLLSFQLRKTLQEGCKLCSIIYDIPADFYYVK